MNEKKTGKKAWFQVALGFLPPPHSDCAEEEWLFWIPSTATALIEKIQALADDYADGEGGSHCIHMNKIEKPEWTEASILQMNTLPINLINLPVHLVIVQPDADLKWDAHSSTRSDLHLALLRLCAPDLDVVREWTATWQLWGDRYFDDDFDSSETESDEEPYHHQQQDNKTD